MSCCIYLEVKKLNATSMEIQLELGKVGVFKVKS